MQYRWKKQTLENLPELFEDDNKSESEQQALDNHILALACEIASTVLYSNLKKGGNLTVTSFRV
jgi:hypothetical protein